MSRVVRSRFFAGCVSVAVHLGVLAAFYGVILREEVAPREVIIPEARLAAPAGPSAPAAPPPLKLSQQTALPQLERPRLADAPLPAVTLDPMAGPPIPQPMVAPP